MSDQTLQHGGALDAQIMRYGGTREDWLDLSTGINPNGYPVGDLPAEIWQRLPEAGAEDGLLEAAYAYYQAPSTAHILAVPGTQALIQTLPTTLPYLSTFIVSPTYGEHAPAWEREGFKVSEVTTANEFNAGGINLLVNPNNPDGRLIAKAELTDFADHVSETGGWLVIDEAFGDVVPDESAASLVADHNVIVMKSIGKFFGLAGLRLGFAIAPLVIIEKLRAHFGPWSVSGPALSVGSHALNDQDWQISTGNNLAQQSERLQAALAKAGFEKVGGCHLFQTVSHERASEINEALLHQKIYVRAFDYDANWLRFGLPADEAQITRLAGALAKAMP